MSPRVLLAGVSCGESRRVVFGDPQNLENGCFTTVKPLFSEIHPNHKITSFGEYSAAFWHSFLPRGLPNSVPSRQKVPFKNYPKNNEIPDGHRTWYRNGTDADPDLPQTPILVTF